ncbi:3-phosphoshikimate 1-carboxyvinyltransferase [Halalkalibacillus halophilus]|uniref:3-phosphoshikimate 1-carboxyvinyltransferase n=1 Tax=Halalkalibacillus halophilus TaxID=392827 RepID=UPI0003FBC7F3|nr:3-phosphoshikimate 1-carboxyvinyltransferase [Halalkalibacillus halophilus]
MIALKPKAPYSGQLMVPGDKSISHRAIILGSLASGTTIIDNFLHAEDCMRTVQAFRDLGIHIEVDDAKVRIESEGFSSFERPTSSIYLGNSGTTARLLLGVLAAFPQQVMLTGDPSLVNRPMDRVINPLRTMGAAFTFDNINGKLPLNVTGNNLSPITYHLPIDSAQLKSSLILAGLLTKGTTKIYENNKTRNHTEKMLEAFGGECHVNGSVISITGEQELAGANIQVPGDFSSAAFWITAAVITPHSEVIIDEVSLNETRIGLIHVLKRMGANIYFEVTSYMGKEPIGKIIAKHSTLHATTLSEEVIPTCIDEIPLLALAATQIDGDGMEFRHINELKFKETDRINATIDALTSLGAKCSVTDDGMYINGKSRLTGGSVNTFDDHRIAMMAAVASSICLEEVILNEVDCINISYPNFFDDMDCLLR